MTIDQGLLAGELTLHGRVMPASNATFVGEIDERRVVYKPVAGERPLWDFPDGTLAAREEAAYVVSEALGWDVVPLTFRRDGPHGPGMVQLWQEPDPVQEAVTLVSDARGARRLPARLRRPRRPRPRGLAGARGHPRAAPDGGLRRRRQQRRPQGRARARDDRRPPLRRGPRPDLPRRAQAPHRAVGLGRRAARPTRTAPVWSSSPTELDDDLGERLGDLVTWHEVEATRRRVKRLLRVGTLPEPGQGWRAIPWPPF